MRLPACLLLAALAAPALAEGLPSPEDVRSMAYSGQIVSVDAAFALTHRATVAGEAPFDEVRSLVEALMVTDPAILAFTERWLEERPDSPYAKAVRAWQLYEAGFAIRGSSMPRWTWAPALDAFATMHAEGMALAQEAYAAAPDLVAASDAVFRFNQTVPRLDGRALRLMLAEVMEATPSRRSLSNALASSAPSWGGEGPAQLEEFCVAYAARIVDAERYTVEACLADHVFDYGYGFGREVAEFVLAQESPAVADDRIHAASLRPDLAPDLLRTALETGATDDLDIALAYDFEVAGPQGLPPLYPHVLARAQEAARRDLLTDPFDRASLAILAITEYPRGNPVADAPPHEAVVATLKARVLASPFDAEAWADLGDAVEDWPDLTVGGGEPMWINAVAYSNHSPYWLANLIDYHLLTLDIAAGNHGTGALSDSDFAFIVSTHWCPMVRAERLWEAACGHFGAGEHGCLGPFSIEERLARLRDEIVVRPECPWEREAPLTELAYSPVEVTLD